MAKVIFIASNRFDKPVWSPVASLLQSRGYEVLVYLADDVAEGKAIFELQVDPHQGLRFLYDGKLIEIDKVAAAWLRRPDSLAYLEEDASRQIVLDADRRRIQAGLWATIPNERWLNAQANIREADYKLIQLLTARKLGFTIPKTVISNSWLAVTKSLPRDLIFKPHHPLAYADNKRLLVLAKRFKQRKDLPIHANPFPGIWQPYIKKTKEWRITIVGQQCFDVAIYTKPSAKDDWRKHQTTPGKVEFVSEQFPEDQKKLCFAYLRQYGLRFGAFDFIESPDGTITFLECNPNGQYGWLEDKLGLPISQAIADELIKIAEAHKPGRS